MSELKADNSQIPDGASTNAFTESLDNDLQILRMRDEMQVVRNHSHQLTQSLLLLGEDRVDSLIYKIHTISPRVIDHPFGRYHIAVTAPTIEKSILSSIPAKFVNRGDEPVFIQHPSYHAFYSPDRRIAFFDKSNYSPIKRLEGWVCGVHDAGLAFEEEAIEHELRHGLFYAATKDFTGRAKFVNEGYARAVLGGWKVRDIAWGMKFEGYPNDDAEKMDRYYQLFRLAQSKEVDDYTLLELMGKNRWWLNENAQIDENTIESHILKYLKEDQVNVWLESANEQNDQLTKWRYDVWSIVHPTILESGEDLAKNWEMEINQEKSIREHYQND